MKAKKSPSIYFKMDRQKIYQGLVTSTKSMTMPGQAVTAQEIIRAMTSGIVPQQIYHDHPISQFQKMDNLEKIDFLKDLASRNIAMADNIKFQVHNLKQKQQIADIKKSREAIIQNATKNDDKLNDDKSVANG